MRKGMPSRIRSLCWSGDPTSSSRMRRGCSTSWILSTWFRFVRAGDGRRRDSVGESTAAGHSSSLAVPLPFTAVRIHCRDTVANPLSRIRLPVANPLACRESACLSRIRLPVANPLACPESACLSRIRLPVPNPLACPESACLSRIRLPVPNPLSRIRLPFRGVVGDAPRRCALFSRTRRFRIMS